MSSLLQDLKFAIRTLKSRWMITSLAVLSLGLAIGGNAAVFSMVDAFIFRPLPYPQPDRVVLMGERQKDQPEFSGNFTTSLPTYADMTERTQSVREWAAIQPRTLSLRGPERSEAVSSVAVTPSFFPLIGVQPAHGRLFLPEEGVEGGRKVAILGHDYRVDRFAEHQNPLGEVLTLNGDPHEIVGVLPEGFAFLFANQDVWVPLQRSPASAARDQRSVLAVGRIRAEATMEQVRAEMVEMADGFEVEFSDTHRGWTIDVFNLRYDIPSRQGRVLFSLLQGSVLLVLIIACVNIMNLLLARGQERAREISLRTVLGAGRARIVRQLLTESSIMVMAGAALGIALAGVGIRAMAAQFTQALPPTYELTLDHRVVLFTLGVAAMAGLLFGLVPALQTYKQGHSQTLKDGGRGGSGRTKKTLTKILVVGEIALSFVALGGGSLLVRSFLELQSADPGFEGGPVFTATVSVPNSRYPEDEDRLLLADQILERAAALAEVEAVALASTLPQAPISNTDTFHVDGVPADAASAAPRAVVVQASAGYLETLDVQLLQGRFFDSSDRLDTERVAVIDRELAQVRFGGENPLARRITVRGESREIVGVVEDIQQVLIQAGPGSTGETIYLPVGQEPEGAGALMLRTRSDPRNVAEPLRSTLQGLDQDLVLSQMLTMDEYVEQFFVGIQIFNAVLGGFGLVALLLASLGTYGVLAYSVSRRGQEIGIRMAMGAESREVVRMFVKQGFRMGVVGLVIGVLLTLPLIGVLQSVLQGLATVQPATLVLIAAVLFGVTMLASFVPAGRAAAVDPIRTLRDE